MAQTLQFGIWNLDLGIYIEDISKDLPLDQPGEQQRVLNKPHFIVSYILS